ncbi:helix-turn-helix transcriptional regulator [Paenibacillus baekrokdamisoli]|uniref:helix-turn-helix transcriptional regulator n=1 Tax=Paenibacillus baekrokdamisoli TaxID=1712516 RepID=UPI0035D3FCC1
MARVERGDLTQEELADLIGASRQPICLIESGKYNPTIKLCLALSKALNKKLDDLFWIEGDDGND